MKEIIQLLHYSKISLAKFAIAFLFAVVSSLFSIIPLQFLGILADQYITSNEASSAQHYAISGFFLKVLDLFGGNSWNSAIVALALFIVTTIVSILVRIAFGYYCTILSDKSITQVRQQVFAHLIRLPMAYFGKNSKGDVIARVTTDTQRLENVFSQPLFTLFSDTLDLIWISIFIAVYMDPILLAILFPFVPVLYYLGLSTGRIQRGIFNTIRDTEGVIVSRVEQALTSMETVKAYNGELRETELFKNTSDVALKHRLSAARNISMFFPIEGTIRTLGIGAVLLYAVIQVNNSLLPAGMILVLYQYATRFFTPIGNFSRYYQTLQNGLASVGRVLTVFNEMPEHIHSSGNVLTSPLEAKLGEIEIADLKIKFDENVLFEDFNLKILPWSFVLLRGHSGSGKTTLLRTLLGLLNPQEGTITIGGNTYTETNRSIIRRNVAYAGQIPHIHELSLVENCLYPSSLASSEQAAIHRAEEVLKSLGFAKEIHSRIAGESGAKLSGGEARRIGLARALTKGTDILLLDEITANLDPENERAIINLLSELKREKTIVLVSHSRNQELENLADRIIDMDEYKSDHKLLEVLSMP